MKRLFITVFLLLAIGPTWAETSKDVLSKASLVGTWHHMSTSKSPQDKGKLLKSAQISWTFKANGEGVYSQTVPALGGPRTNPMTWVLEGETIVLSGKIKYTVMSFDGERMVWKNQRLGDYYHVERR